MCCMVVYNCKLLCSGIVLVFFYLSFFHFIHFFIVLVFFYRKMVELLVIIGMTCSLGLSEHFSHIIWFDFSQLISYKYFFRWSLWTTWASLHFCTHNNILLLVFMNLLPSGILLHDFCGNGRILSFAVIEPSDCAMVYLWTHRRYVYVCLCVCVHAQLLKLCLHIRFFCFHIPLLMCSTDLTMVETGNDLSTSSASTVQ